MTSTAARLEWAGPSFLPPALIEELMGTGAPFKLVEEEVLGARMSVFAARPLSLPAMYEQRVAETPDAAFLVSGDRTWTFAEVAQDIESIAWLLTTRYGISHGDRVALIAANSAEYGMLMWATLSLGAVVTSLNGWWTGSEIEYGIELTEPALLAGDERRLSRVEPGAVSAGVPVRRLDDLVTEARALSDPGEPDVEIDEDDPAVILFTSGTTGRPKGATLSHRNIINFSVVNRLGSTIGAALAPPDADVPAQPASILSSPMFHVSGMLAILMSGPALGSKLVVPPPGRWDATRHLELTAQHRISTWSGVPTQFWRILRHPDLDSYDLRCVRNIASGGAPFPPELVRAVRERLPWVSLGNGYGMSETVGMGTLNAGPVMIEHPDSVGTANVGVQVEIRDEFGDPVSTGAVGEIHLRTPSVFLGYWGDLEATEACLDRDRWYRTGDFGRIEDHMLYLESRMRDLILRGGENIYPMEIEHRLVEHPDIDDAAVIGIVHEELGQEVKAFVVLAEGASLQSADVQRWAAEALAAFKVPAHVEFRSELPYTDTGKVLKHQLEPEHAERRGSGV